ncbi:HNH endonuclease [Nitrosomonas sp. Nm58]|jgi:hypothetical protein|uniref:HNH endonuclease n=1 Tax=Nitrosomonas sp. Nm58 TaxID=200126 RepID=UPI0008977C30|nr:HNH endonuclease [Nitrosomonas sp. Nm58]SDY38539.1 hypothetical protein SAMN05421754_100846 [Nitrosomonas sp. Nm58]
MQPDQTSVLCMSDHPKSRQTVRRHYLAWRKRQGLPERCDNSSCQFFSVPLQWNGKPLPLILDHESGNSRDNRTENLRLLCPNCDSQNTSTRGGANAGRIKVLPGGSYQVKHRDGRQDGYANGAVIGVQVTAPVGNVAAVISYPNGAKGGSQSDV